MTRSRRIGLVLTPLAVLAGVVATAATAAAPTAITGAATKLTKVSASLSGTVNPKGEYTSYSFQYGPDANYGSQTPPVDAGAGTTHTHATADLAGLQPGTTYHFRVVATNASGTTPGQDKTFTTRSEPLVYHLRVSATSVIYGSAVVVSGQLGGQNSAGRQLVLQSRTFPFKAAWANTGDPVTASPTGSYAFRVASVAASTEYRVAPADSTAGPSRGVTVSVAPLVTTRVSTAHPLRGKSVRFSGTMRPASSGARFAIQKRSGTGWVTVAGGVVHGASGGVSTYAKTIRVSRGGQYRVFVRIANGSLSPGFGRTKHIRPRGH